MKKILKKILLIIAAVTLSSCASGVNRSANNSNETYKEPVTFTDSEGRTVTVSSPSKTAVFTGSLADLWQLAGGTVSFATEDAFDNEDISLPEDAVNIGLLNSPSAELLIDGEADFAVLSPTVHGGMELAETLEQTGITCAFFEIEDFSDYLKVLKICTDITGRHDLYEQNGAAKEEKINGIISKQQNKEQKTVLYLRAYSTGIKAKGGDSMTGKMLADMNCINIADTVPSLLEELSIEEIIQQDPDLIFITIMDDDEEKAKKSYEDSLVSNPAWNELSAVKNGRCIFLPKRYFHNKPNAEWDKAYEMLAEILNDEKTN